MVVNGLSTALKAARNSVTDSPASNTAQIKAIASIVLVKPEWYRFGIKEVAMSTNLTLKNIPDNIYDSLKQAALLNHRSLNSEVLACLEQILLPTRISPEARLERAKKLRSAFDNSHFHTEDIAAAIEQGRP